MRIGFTELLLIILLVVALIKPSELKAIARRLGEIYKEITDVTHDIKNSVPVQETQKSKEGTNENRFL